ncbi:MAG: FAD-dependent oxidoreductase [Spirochaetales bacterium]|nr:FAD-dependent oxidoreductase [Spirochaetales bacterium]
MNKVYDVGIIGGGISGTVTALQLANNGKDIILFEQNNSIINGPPFCHLHAGGNLYPDISDEQCRILMKQSIEMARLFPQSIDERPTLISIPRTEKLEPNEIKRRLTMLVGFYKQLIDEDRGNEILGQVDDYFKMYDIIDLRNLSKKPRVEYPKSLDDWLCNAIKVIDYSKLKMPLFMVREYGWNLFRLAAHAQLALESSEYCDLKTETKVTKIEDVRGKSLDHNWTIFADKKVYKVKYLVNSAGYKADSIEKTFNFNTESLIEFKAAYISKWDKNPGLLPEIIFHGERGTPNGMAQLTPYSGNYYQIHGMTNEITLFEGGLIKNKTAKGFFNKKILKKLNGEWKKREIYSRTRKAIKFVARFVPSFKFAKVGGPPMFGAQQIVGNDSSLRVAEVSFPEKFYARSEIIKASSALTVANKIVNDVLQEDPTFTSKRNTGNPLLESVLKEEIDHLAKEISTKRGYSETMANLLVQSHNF